MCGGDPVRGEYCPSCGREDIVYNGNYWCTHCDWVMGETGRPRRIIKAYLIQRYQEAEANDDRQTMARMAHHLAEYADDKAPP